MMYKLTEQLNEYRAMLSEAERQVKLLRQIVESMEALVEKNSVNVTIAGNTPSPASSPGAPANEDDQLPNPRFYHAVVKALSKIGEGTDEEIFRQVEADGYPFHAPSNTRFRGFKRSFNRIVDRLVFNPVARTYSLSGGPRQSNIFEGMK